MGKGLVTSLKSLIPAGGGGASLVSKLGGGLLSKAGSLLGRIGLKGLARVGLNFLGPVGWAINAGLMAWDVWNLLKDTGLGKAIWHGLKNIGSSIWSGVKSLFGIGGSKTTKPVAEKGSLVHKVAEIAKIASPIGGALALAHKVSSWFSHFFGKEEEKEPPKEVKHFEKLHKEVVRETTNTQKVETIKEETPIEVKPNITFNVSVNSTEPQKVKEEILKTLERLTPDLLDWLERALEELRHRNSPVY